MSLVIRAKLSGLSLGLWFNLLVRVDSASKTVMPHQGSQVSHQQLLSFVIRAEFSDLLLGVFTPQHSFISFLPTRLVESY